MKLKVITGIVLTLFLICMLTLAFNTTPVKASGTIIYVDDDNTGFEDGSQAHPYNTIWEGINAANSGDTVRVKAGTYYEHISPKSDIWLMGEDWRTTIIDGGYGGIVVGIWNIDCNISGFTIRNGHKGIDASIDDVRGYPYPDPHEVFIIENTIENCDIGLYANYSTGMTVYHNNFRNNTSTFGYFEQPEEPFNTWDNGYEGNYWDEYTGLDNGSGVGRFGEPRVAGDGIGDTNIPFQPSGAMKGIDWYPLMSPWTPPPPVGGYIVPINKLELLIPYIGVISIILVTISVVVKKRRLNYTEG